MSCRANRAVLLDRDGVLTQSVIIDGKPHPPGSLTDMVILPDVLSSLLNLKRAGFLLIVATNQPGVARGTLSREAVEAMHAKLRAELPVDDILTCYHDDSNRCTCRKPLPGLLYQASRAYRPGFTLLFPRRGPLARYRRGKSRGLPKYSDRLRISGKGP